MGDRVKALIDEAREQARALREDAAEEAKRAIVGDRVPVQSTMLSFKPEHVLVRLKVEHSGFSTLNNQRFGSRFVGEVVSMPGCRLVSTTILAVHLTFSALKMCPISTG